MNKILIEILWRYNSPEQLSKHLLNQKVRGKHASGLGNQSKSDREDRREAGGIAAEAGKQAVSHRLTNVWINTHTHTYTNGISIVMKLLTLRVYIRITN